MSRKKNGRNNNKQNLKIISIDPGCKNTGWSICELTPGRRIRILDCGVLIHDYSMLDNKMLIKKFPKYVNNLHIIIENPPIIRVNISISQALAKIYGVLWAELQEFDYQNFYAIYPRVWQVYLTKDRRKELKTEGKKLHPKEKERLITTKVNKCITRKKLLANPHIIDTTGMVIWYIETQIGITVKETAHEKIK